MRVTIQTPAGFEQYYRFSFSHERFRNPIKLDDKRTVSTRTTCIITRSDTDDFKDEAKIVVRGSGIALCSTSDNFSKEEGRKRALTRALEWDFSKSERTAFWKVYFDRFPKEQNETFLDNLKGLAKTASATEPSVELS